ncbi:hypothetical protein AYI70_g11972 [Smittium culicis]|uniref:Uncharacterized protein n=1 Tax=Smittium culicis TaxID=133412 RepID=A0A1R1WZH8_9FUNG|nr:hypothetical protein AYI70_g11972 [Smittium culicis]
MDNFKESSAFYGWDKIAASKDSLQSINFPEDLNDSIALKSIESFHSDIQNSKNSDVHFNENFPDPNSNNSEKITDLSQFLDFEFGDESLIDFDLSKVLSGINNPSCDPQNLENNNINSLYADNIGEYFRNDNQLNPNIAYPNDSLNSSSMNPSRFQLPMNLSTSNNFSSFPNDSLNFSQFTNSNLSMSPHVLHQLISNTPSSNTSPYIHNNTISNLNIENPKDSDFDNFFNENVAFLTESSSKSNNNSPIPSNNTPSYNSVPTDSPSKLSDSLKSKPILSSPGFVKRKRKSSISITKSSKIKDPRTKTPKTNISSPDAITPGETNVNNIKSNESTTKDSVTNEINVKKDPKFKKLDSKDIKAKKSIAKNSLINNSKANEFKNNNSIAKNIKPNDPNIKEIKAKISITKGSPINNPKVIDLTTNDSINKKLNPKDSDNKDNKTKISKNNNSNIKNSKNKGVDLKSSISSIANQIDSDAIASTANITSPSNHLTSSTSEISTIKNYEISNKLKDSISCTAEVLNVADNQIKQDNNSSSVSNSSTSTPTPAVKKLSNNVEKVSKKILPPSSKNIKDFFGNSPISKSISNLKKKATIKSKLTEKINKSNNSRKKISHNPPDLINVNPKLPDLLNFSFDSANSLLSSFNFLKNGSTLNKISISPQNLIAISLPHHFETNRPLSNDKSHNLTPETNSSESFELNEKNLFNIFKIVNIADTNTKNSINKPISTLRIFPVGQLSTNCNNPAVSDTSFDHESPKNLSINRKSNNSGIWWSPDGDFVAISDTFGSISVFYQSSSLNKWSPVDQVNIKSPVSSLLWISNKRKYISSISFLAKGSKKTKNNKLLKPNIDISFARTSPCQISKFSNLFFTLSISGRLNSFNVENKLQMNGFIDIPTPLENKKKSGHWVITHSDISVTNYDCFEDYHKSKSLVDPLQKSNHPKNFTYLSVLVHWQLFEDDSFKNDLSELSIGFHIVEIDPFHQSFQIISSSTIKPEPLPYHTTIVKLSPENNIFHSLSTSNEANISRLPRIIIVQTKPPEITSSEFDNTSYDTIIVSYDPVVKKPTKSESSKVVKLKFNKVLNFRNFRSTDDNNKFIHGYPVGVQILYPSSVLDSNFLSKIDLFNSKNLYHLPWVVFWSNGEVSKFCYKISSGNLMSNDYDTIIPSSGSFSNQWKSWAVSGALTPDCTNLLRVGINYQKKENRLVSVNCGDLELINLSTLDIFSFFAGSQPTFFSLEDEPSSIRKGRLELSKENTFGAMLSLRIINGHDTSDIISLMVDSVNSKDKKLNIEDTLSHAIDFLCGATNSKTISLSPLDPKSHLFTTFFGVVMKIYSLINPNSSSSTCMGIILHLTSVSSAYHSAITSTSRSLTQHSPNFCNTDSQDPISFISASFIPTFFVKTSEAKQAADNNTVFSNTPSFEDWASQFPVYLSQAIWAANALTYMLKEFLSLFQSHQSISILTNPSIDTKSINTDPNLSEIPSLVVLLLNAQILTSIIDSISLIILLKNDISNKLFVIYQSANDTFSNSSWVLPRSQETLIQFHRQLYTTLNSLPIPIEATETFFKKVLTLVKSETAAFKSLSSFDCSKMLISGLVNQSLSTLIPKISKIFTNTILSLEKITFSIPNSHPSLLLQKKDLVNLILSYRSVCINVFDSSQSHLITSVPQKHTNGFLFDKSSTDDSLIKASENSHLWYTRTYETPNPKPSIKLEPEIMPAQLGLKSANTSVTPDAQIIKVENNNSLQVSQNKSEKLQNSGIPSEISLSKSPISSEPYLISLFPSIKPDFLNFPFIDCVRKSFISPPIQSLFSHYHTMPSDFEKSQLLDIGHSVSDSILRVCSMCGQLSSFNPPPFINSLLNTPVNQPLCQNKFEFGDSNGQSNNNLSRLSASKSTDTNIPVYQNPGSSADTLTGSPPFMLNNKALDSDRKSEFGGVFNLIDFIPENSAETNFKPFSQQESDYYRYYNLWIRRYDLVCICGGHWISI